MEGPVPTNLEVTDLAVSIRRSDTVSELVSGVSFTVGHNEAVGLLGPSGAGKTTVALAILGLPPGGGNAAVSGSIRFAGRELTTLPEPEYRSVRGPGIGMVFQDPAATLIPVYRVGRLVADSLLAHQKLSRSQAADRVRSLLAEVGFDDPAGIAKAYPHQLSGGMSQRVAVALALANEPDLLIADEPTSSLDALATDEILTAIERIRDQRDISILFISHDPGVIERMTDRTVTIEDGRTVTASPAGPERDRPMGARIRPAGPELADPEADLAATVPVDKATDFALELRDISAAYSAPRGRKQAVTGVSLTIRPGETLGLIGENGAGKTTVTRTALRLLKPQAGQVFWGDVDVTDLGQGRLRALRPRISAVLQHPASSLNPRHQISRIVATPLIARGMKDRDQRERLAREALALVDLPASMDGRLPRELSGGQQQRVALARAIVNRPRVLICDEPFTALDHPLRDQLTGLLARLQSELGLACLFIDHDFELVTRISDRIAVMQDGKIIEAAPTETILASPTQHFTRRLVDLIG